MGLVGPKTQWKIIIDFCFKSLRFGVVCHASINFTGMDSLLQPPQFPDKKSGTRVVKASEQSSSWVRSRLRRPDLQTNLQVHHQSHLIYMKSCHFSSPLPASLLPPLLLVPFYSDISNLQKISSIEPEIPIYSSPRCTNGLHFTSFVSVLSKRTFPHRDAAHKMNSRRVVSHYPDHPSGNASRNGHLGIKGV